jgi:DNA-binding response OmpR family regulator
VSKLKALIIEDDPEVIKSVSLAFRARWPQATTIGIAEGNKGIEAVETETPDIVLLDLGLPDMDGLEVLRQTRLFSYVPIIIITVRNQEIDKLKGLEMGADDYLTKPFSYLELTARVNALFRRISLGEQKASSQTPFSSGDLSINFDTQEVFVQGKPTRLTPIQYKLLYYLVSNAGHTVPQSTLVTNIWGEEEVDIGGESLKVHIHYLRQKLGDNPHNPTKIITVPGVGYKFNK